MQAQDLSYKLNNQTFAVNDKNSGLSYTASVEVISLENVYTVPEGSLKQTANGYEASTLVWANTEPVEGGVKVAMSDLCDGTAFSMQATLPRPIRSVKLRLDDLPLGKLLTLTDEDKDVTEYGRVCRYPEGWRTLATPLLVFALENGTYLYVRCLDNTVNRKTFFLKKEGKGMRIDIVQEQAATVMASTFDVPTVEVGIVNDVEVIYDRQSETVKQTYALDEYETCSIKPVWLDEISLVVTLHMQAFTGYIFHTYEQAYEDIAKLCKMIDGRRILVYMPGWEGRYYYKYGDYTADDRMGGAEKLKECVAKMQALGCKVMAMYGINIVNKHLAPVKDIVAETEFVTMGGGRYHCGSVNWEGAHHYDYGDHAQLNVAHPVWQDNLFNQIKDVTDKYGFDGAFLDIAACYTNDRNYKIFEGVVEFCDRLRTIKPNFLVSGEGYYDGLSKAMPLFQSGHTDGWLHYHDRPSEKLFTRFSREFAHLNIGDASRGSTGVHEQGTNTDWRTPVRKGIIPTMSLVEHTIEEAPEKVALIIEDAKEYARRYLDGKQ